jgi:AraC-like DNA-binding protein
MIAAMGSASRSESDGTLSVLMVRAIAMGAATRGLSPPELCARFDLDPALLADVDGRVSVPIIVRLWNEVPALVDDDDFGLHLAELTAAAPQSLGGHMIGASPTLGDGVRRILRFERVFHDVRSSELILDGDAAIMRHDARGGIAVPRHALEFGWAWLILLARRVTGAPIAPVSIAFAHAAPARSDEHARILGVRPRFGADVAELVLARRDLERPSLVADASLLEILDSHAQGLLSRLPAAPDLVANLRAAVERALARGALTIAKVAPQLGVSPRTLQRRLADEHGTSFQAVVDEVRAQLARHWLDERELSVAEVAFALGFADQSAFHRAFVRWTGATPGQYRRRATT